MLVVYTLGCSLPLDNSVVSPFFLAAVVVSLFVGAPVMEVAVASSVAATRGYTLRARVVSRRHGGWDLSYLLCCVI
jgi:hypothetical protein